MARRLLKETRLLLNSVPAVIVALFVASVICMNLLANKSIDLNVSWLALDGGIFFSWMAFLAMDIVTKRFGVKAANILSVFALLVNLLVALILFAVSYVPGTWSQSYLEGSQGVINAALDGTVASTWYVIMGSSVAFIASAFVNNILNALIAKRFEKKNFLAFSVSSYASTLIGQFVDNMLFAFIVSLNFFGWTAVQCVMCAVTGAIAELLLEVVFSPFGYRIVRRMERDETGKAYLDFVAAGREEK